ncbi:hypothetical protein O6H91_08G119000 [Diphasiastrum complanatum]|uniref:Uncharacterized protein n=1 Tax=Diphasiastrum complanatum TaxID=34168 RepID=A0ACC2D1U8_DIPCM|nr:hypothetical protein O6H91_08G119000 [Diphasiastrum complanatum]
MLLRSEAMNRISGVERNCERCDKPLFAVEHPTGGIFERRTCEDCREWMEQQVQLFNDSQEPGTDVVLESSDGGTIPAHKAVLEFQSDVFRRMFDSNFKESFSNRVNTDMTSDELRCLIQFVYTNNLSDDDLKHNAFTLLDSAETYNLQHLKSFCEDYISKNISMKIFEKIVRTAELYGSVHLRDALMSFVLSENFMLENSLTIITGAFRAMADMNGYDSFSKGYPDLMSRLIDQLFIRERSEAKGGNKAK